jgi:hypothetical protein
MLVEAGGGWELDLVPSPGCDRWAVPNVHVQPHSSAMRNDRLTEWSVWRASECGWWGTLLCLSVLKAPGLF